jgi:transcriptional regulator with XRE-family HTH domain
MGERADWYKDIDANIAANVRAYREARGISQEDLAGQLAETGFPFSQATIWKIENGQRPVKAAELAALADALEVRSAMTLTRQPDNTRHLIDLQQAAARASSVWHQVKDAATEYLDAQINLLVAAYEAREAGVTVTELETAWLTTTPEEAVIQARVDSDDEETRSEKLNGQVVKVLDALRANGYEPHLRVEDVTTEGGGDIREWVPDASLALPAKASEPGQRTTPDNRS